MLDQIITLVTEAVDEGFDRAINNYIIELEESLEREEIYEQYGLDGVLRTLFEEAGIEVPEPYNEEDADKLLAELESDIENDNE
jgi:hypothetical protein